MALAMPDEDKMSEANRRQVQEALHRLGYYDGPIDGILGSMTREAIAAYQADNGLAITSAIDEPTLATLGLV